MENDFEDAYITSLELVDTLKEEKIDLLARTMLIVFRLLQQFDDIDYVIAYFTNHIKDYLMSIDEEQTLSEAIVDYLETIKDKGLTNQMPKTFLENIYAIFDLLDNTFMLRTNECVDMFIKYEMIIKNRFLDDCIYLLPEKTEGMDHELYEKTLKLIKKNKEILN